MLSLSLGMLAAGVGLFVAAGLARSATEERKGGTLRLSAPADVDSVDPAVGYFPRSWMLSYATCAKLFNYPDAQGAAGTRLVPEVVERYTISRDQRTYTFELRQTFRFHTGAPVTAHSFVAAINRVAQPKLESPATAYMREIDGVAAVSDGKAQTISGVRALGRYRLQIRLTRPVGDLTARLTMPFFCPILPGTPIAEIDTPAGSGPYYVAERIVNQRIVLKRNRYYRGNRPANVDEVVVTIDELKDCLLAIEQVTIDYCYLGGGLPAGALFRELEERHGINRPGGRFFVSPSLTTSFVAFNHDRPAFAGPGQIPLKQAINHAIDRPELTRQLGYLSANRADQMLPRGLARPTSIYPLRGSDYATARRMLARARNQPKRLVLYANSFSVTVAQAEILAFNLKQIGIDLQVKYFDIGALPGKLATRGEPYDLALAGWFADYADPAAFFVPILNRGSGQGVNLDDPRIDARIEAANRLTGEARRRAAWADLDVDLMRDNPPWAPYVHTQTRTLVSKGVGCVVVHPLYGFDIAAVCKKR
ncbi:MAG TPA: ABC transporter substrate-binding protein [Gaiella sp.]|uniref:ABC transporter substrate-binding protein n=1 Tax=Gaiella sp. TaxID=2663207 RepID=UPI002D7E1DBE|nr:ABC transporter substrate-binding protein [Gaiella sp.]HET9286844.1 ABC transporter substrate-binding protein [Gaiella sp.]